MQQQHDRNNTMNNYRLTQHELDTVCRGFAYQWLKNINSWLEMYNGKPESEYISLQDFVETENFSFNDRMCALAFSRIARITNEERGISFDESKVVEIIRSYSNQFLHGEEFSQVKTYLIGKAARKAQKDADTAQNAQKVTQERTEAKAVKMSTLAGNTDYSVQGTPYSVSVTRSKGGRRSYSTYRIYGEGDLNGKSGIGGIKTAMQIITTSGHR
jgi:hypothetical protein